MNLDYIDIQDKIFTAVSDKFSTILPLNISLSAITNDRMEADVLALQEQRLIVWDFNMKTQPWGTPVSNPDHLIKLIAYYGDAVNGYYCVGYAIGCVNKDGNAIELDFIEKRSDASTDLAHQFLPLVIEAFSMYALFLNNAGATNITKFAIMSPIQVVRKYYSNEGFTLELDYFGTEAMTKPLAIK